uniref:Solute carrier family 12 member 3 n=1 Tax=Panagrolaimus davidi TaxID=227884 RepID=A0A914QPD9_9BILA
MLDKNGFKKCIPHCLSRNKNNTANQIHPLPSSAHIENGSINSEHFTPPLVIENNIIHYGKEQRNISELINYAEDFNKIDLETNTTNSVDGRSSEEFNVKGFEGFGWITTGVLIRCILCIFGATLFLRMSWIAGQSGIVFGFGVILLSCIVVLLTAISMSAIATNGEIKNGGCYYLVSRSLGPEYGGAIGLIFYIANTINASMNCVGLAEALRDILKEYDFYLIDGGINDIRIYAIVVCLILQLIIFIGTEFENKTQLLLMVTIVISIFSHSVGTFLPLSKEQIQKGVTGYSLRTFYDNLYPDYRNDISFISTFGVYFPAMTGIMGGANMSGDLKDPSKSIPKGTMWAIAITTFTYAWAMITTAATAVRDSTGFDAPEYDEFGHFIPPLCRLNNTCPYGLANDMQLMKLQSIWPPLIIVGIFATTLSSASGCLIGAPRVFQALCADKLYPGISYFAKGQGKNNDPFRAYILTWTIASAVILIGDLNVIAEVITNFFLAAFALTNFACFDATSAKSPGFRPGFKYYNSWLSLLGSVLCVTIMFVLSWIISLATFIIFALLFLFIKHNKSHINWGTSTEANRYRKALSGLIKVSRQTAHVKTYRPQLLVLTGNLIARQALVDFSNSITKGTNLLVCGHVIPAFKNRLLTAKSNNFLVSFE